MRLVAAVVLLAACLERPIYTCDEWTDCGQAGACEPVAAACSFVDDTCPSNRRFSEFAPGDYRGACVEVVEGAGRGELCEPGPNACRSFRECLGNRCVTVDQLSSNSNFFLAHCASTLDGGYAPAVLWGNTSFGQFAPTASLLGTCPVDCPLECTTCRADCPTNCGMPNADVQACVDCALDCELYCKNSEAVSSVSAGDNHYCYTSGRMSYCLGENVKYQVGFPANDAYSGWWMKTCGGDPFMCFAKTYTIISAGIEHTCAAFPFGGPIECWGDNTFGQSGAAPSPPSPIPIVVEPFPRMGGEEPLEIGWLAASGRFTCAATSERVACWGETPTTPGIVAELNGGSFSALEVGIGHACVIDEGRVKCWGANERGQSAPGDGRANVPPTVVLPELEFVNVTAGREHTCAITTTGATYCWGDGSRDQLGEDAPGPGPHRLNMPTAVGPIAASDNSTCALHLDDRIRCWGDVVQIAGNIIDDFEICPR
ncbi:MAG: RCC1 domain-containing protein [Kofleriaceae bacterium]